MPTTSEAVTESETSGVGTGVSLTVGIVVIVLVLMAAMLAVVVIVPVLLKKHGIKKKSFSHAGKGQAISNITYDTKGQFNQLRYSYTCYS